MAMDKNTIESLTILTEECAEVIQTISKIFRFGIDATYNDSPTNVESLHQELGDLLAMIDILSNIGLIDNDTLTLAKQKKFDKLQKWSSISFNHLHSSK